MIDYFETQMGRGDFDFNKKLTCNNHKIIPIFNLQIYTMVYNFSVVRRIKISGRFTTKEMKS